MPYFSDMVKPHLMESLGSGVLVWAGNTDANVTNEEAVSKASGLRVLSHTLLPVSFPGQHMQEEDEICHMGFMPVGDLHHSLQAAFLLYVVRILFCF